MVLSSRINLNAGNTWIVHTAKIKTGIEVRIKINTCNVNPKSYVF